MSEYVELGEIISVLKQRYDRLSGLRPDFYAGYMAAVKIIEQETRTADVAPVVHGRWLTWEEQFPGEIPKKKSRLGVFCSACHNHADNMFDFCPNCSAKMDGEDGKADGTI